MKRIVVLAISCILSIFVVSGCTLFSHDSISESPTKESNMLNDRQKKILEKEGLPTDYNELSLSKKIAIEAIEDMFQYLDKQYPDETFEYAGYISQSTLESEQLLVNSKYGKVTVYRDVSGSSPVYKDDFKEAKASDIYASVINDYLSASYNDEDYLVYVVVSKCEGHPDQKSIIKSRNANTTVFVRQKAGDSCFQSIASSVSDYIGKNSDKASSAADIFLVKDEEYGLQLPEQYENNIDMGIFIKQMSYYHRENGEEKLYEVER